MTRLRIITEFGTWEQAPVNLQRLINLVARWLPRGGKFDAAGYLKNGPAVTVMGTNRYNGQPVNEFGASFDLWLFVKKLAAEFPDLPKKNPGSVDRNQNHNPDGALSDHAKAKASDQYPWTREYGWKVVDHVDAMMDAAPVVVSYEGIKTQAGVAYWVWDGWIRRAGESRRRLKPTSNQHKDHGHFSVGLVDRRNQTSSAPLPAPAPPKNKDPRRTLRYRGRAWPRQNGEDVRLVQGVVGAKQDGGFGPMTAYSVKQFQKKHGLVVDGVVGPQTWAAIDKVVT